MAYKILHTGVGPFPQGRVVTEEQLNDIPGMNVDRLLNVGAISIADAKESVSPEPLPPGPENPGKMNNKADSDNAPGGTQGDGGEEGEGTGTEEDAVDYSGMKKDELLEAASKRNLEVDDTMTKAEIIAKLQEADASRS